MHLKGKDKDTVSTLCLQHTGFVSMLWVKHLMLMSSYITSSKDFSVFAISYMTSIITVVKQIFLARWHAELQYNKSKKWKKLLAF